jgi:hypothetical protein
LRQFGLMITQALILVARQRETGIDLVNDGEYGHSMGMGAKLTTSGGRGINPQRPVGGVHDLHALVELGHRLLDANETRPRLGERARPTH